MSLLSSSAASEIELSSSDDSLNASETEDESFDQSRHRRHSSRRSKNQASKSSSAHPSTELLRELREQQQHLKTALETRARSEDALVRHLLLTGGGLEPLAPEALAAARYFLSAGGLDQPKATSSASTSSTSSPSAHASAPTPSATEVAMLGAGVNLTAMSRIERMEAELDRLRCALVDEQTLQRQEHEYVFDISFILIFISKTRTQTFTQIN